MELSDYRAQIDRIDAELLRLFAERMQTAAGIAAYKKEHALPVLDTGREREKLAGIVKAAPEDLQEEAVSLFRLLFSLSRGYQRSLLGSSSTLPEILKQAVVTTPQLFPTSAAVVCQGVEGAYSQQACDKLFQHPSVFFCATFDKVFAAIEQGLCQYGILPLENSTAGSVNAVYDLMQKHNFSIVRSVRLRVDHSLLALPGTKLSDIREIVSHGQALEQCSEFLKQLPNVTVTRCENTAAAARMVAESGRKDLAAIASNACAEIYGWPTSPAASIRCWPASTAAASTSRSLRAARSPAPTIPSASTSISKPPSTPRSCRSSSASWRASASTSAISAATRRRSESPERPHPRLPAGW